MVNFERYTHRARRAVVLAFEHARFNDHSHVGPEHLLYGCAAEEGGVAHLALAEHGVTAQRVAEAISALPGVRLACPPLSPSATESLKQDMENAAREALELGNNYIATEHLLLALIRHGQPGWDRDTSRARTVLQVLDQLGADRLLIQGTVRRLLGAYFAGDTYQPPPPGTPTPPESVPMRLRKRSTEDLLSETLLHLGRIDLRLAAIEQHLGIAGE